jgi:hypothetical protein
MKKIYLTLLSCFIAIVTMAQTPGFSYQAVILNPNTQILPGNNVEQGLLSESNIMLRFTIENDGGAEYQETHTTKTDAYGMVSLMVGQGMATIGNFTEVAWVGSEKYLKVEIDFTASGASYESLDRQALTYIPQPVSNETMAILDQINADVSSNNDAIQNEVTRATIAEQANTDALDAEIVRATAAEGVNATAIADETTRATTAEGVNATAIADENTRATASEGVNATAIADETTRATASEGVNATAIADENTRATAAEGVNATAVSNETTRATNAEQANADAILVEETRATNSEQANANAISVEETRATNSEQANADAILVEETRATNSEQANADAISAEATRATNAEQANADAISAEATRATNAEQANADAISVEATRATNAEQANADAISAEATRATNAETALQSDIDLNEADTDAAIQNETNRATATEVVNAASILTEETRATAAEGVNASAITEVGLALEKLKPILHTHFPNELYVYNACVGVVDPDSWNYPADPLSNLCEVTTSSNSGLGSDLSISFAGLLQFEAYDKDDFTYYPRWGHMNLVVNNIVVSVRKFNGGYKNDDRHQIDEVLINFEYYLEDVPDNSVIKLQFESVHNCTNDYYHSYFFMSDEINFIVKEYRK